MFGTGEVGLRSLSAILGVGLVPLLYLCGRELVSARAGVIAAALAAVNPFMIDYSREAREYMLLVVLCTASLLFFARAWRTGVKAGPDVVGRPVGAGAADAVLRRLSHRRRGGAAGLPAAQPRERAALGAQALVLAPFVPHVIPRLTGKAAFITDQGLAPASSRSR